MKNIYDELKKRNIIAQVTNEEKVATLLNEKNIHFYIGFDPTADSLHVGHFVQFMIMSRLQKAGHIPIILFGGGTGFVGDPSNKTDMRKMLTREQINHNVECFKKQASKFLDLEKTIVVNNAEWLTNLKYIDFLREVGVHFSVNRMLAAECYKARLEKGLTFFELNYMLMQSYDFLVLNKKYGCVLQLGGDDQWSNIIGGVELVRKMEKKEVYGLTFKLLTTSSGKKMGKTEKGALWLNKEKTSPYEFYQYWRNIEDNDVINCFNMLTFLTIEEIEKFKLLSGSEVNKAKEVLAFEITKLVHGEEEAQKAQKTARELFVDGKNSENMPSYKLLIENLVEGKISVLSILTLSSMVNSKNEARRLIKQGGINISGKKITDENFEFSSEELKNGVVVKKGKKIYKKIFLE